jgi:hypothetical protein
LKTSTPQEMADLGFDVQIFDPFCLKPKPPSRRVATVTELLRSSKVLANLMAAYVEWRPVCTGTKPLTMPETVSFGTHSEALERLQGICIPFVFAAEEYGDTETFDAIFDAIVVSTGKVDEQFCAVTEACRVMRQHGDRLPKRSELEQALRSCCRSESAMVAVFREHLLRHGMESYVDRVIAKEEFECKFPIDKLHSLGKLRDTPAAEWSREQAALAAVATSAFGGDHWLLRQVTNYKWVEEHFLAVEVCHTRLRGTLQALSPSKVDFEVPVAMYGEEAREYAGLPFPVVGLMGRVDCVVMQGDEQAHIIEIKFTRDLGEEHRVQTFLYMCLWAVQQARLGKQRGVEAMLHNMRTGETVQAYLSGSAPAAAILETALDLHFDATLTADAVFEQLRAQAALAGKRARAECV